MVLLNPRLWRKHRDLLLELMGKPGDSGDGSKTFEPAIATLEERSAVLTFRPPSTGNLSTPRRQQMEDIHKLDSMNAETNMLQLCRAYFDGISSASSATLDMARFEEKVVVLLNWAMASFQLGIHRAYSVHTLLTMWRELHEDYQSKNTRPAQIDFFPILYRWLDTSEAAKSKHSLQAIGITFGELTRQGLFSYGRYLQTLIAEGHSARSRRPGQPASHHLRILRSLPIFVEARDLLQQRRLALFGEDSELRDQQQAEEEQHMQAFKEETKEFVPEVFGYKRYGRSSSYKEAVNHRMPSADRITRYLFLQARFWLYPLAAESLVIQGRRPALTASAFARVLHVFRLCYGFSTIADYLVKALQVSQDEEILDVIIDTVRRDADTWTAMDRWEPIIEALLERNAEQDGRGRHHTRLSTLLLEMSNRLQESDLAAVESSIEKHKIVSDVSARFALDAHTESLDTVRRSMGRQGKYVQRDQGHYRGRHRGSDSIGLEALH